MLSCAAIQKLERYGQLAQKRRSVDDFVSSSLKDSRRGNVYALTHLPTWESCLSSLASQTSYTPPHEAKEVDEDGENVHGATAAGDNRAENEQTTHSTSNIKSDSNEYNQTVNIGTHNSANLTSISDSLIYAVSYAVSLNVHHMDVQRFTRGTCSTGKDGDAVKMYQEYDVSNSSTASGGEGVRH
ncbi:hypothetical protein TRVL_01153 [Trypanosoma vivax]|nr:hypothetical protein TRVL_01153 [Trypanosoma vivax]